MTAKAQGRPSTKPLTAAGRRRRKRASSTRVIRVRVPREARVSASYLTLVAAYPLRPIRSEEELDEAIAVAAERGLLPRGGAPSRDGGS